jgi:arabinan endo-1,5-alpha-L-arabinosidase
MEKWTDHGSTGVASSAGKDYNAIDGNLIADGSNYYMAFGSFWSDLFSTALSISDSGTLKATGSAKQLAFQSSGTHAVEGAFVFQHGNYFYLFFSAGVCCGLDKTRPASGAEYKIMVCRSSKANSGFVDKSGKDCKSGGGTTLLPSHGWVYAPGGQGVMQDKNEGPVLYYHYGEFFPVLR